MQAESIAGFASPATRAKWEKKVEDVKHVGLLKTIDLSSIYPIWHRSILARLRTGPNGFGTYLLNKADYGHFDGFVNANTTDAIHVKLTEMPLLQRNRSICGGTD